MAIIRSIGVGKGRKSVGDVTYAVVRGRTVMKSRIVENKSNTKLQADQRDAFKKVEYISRGFRAVVNQFDKTRWGTRENKFVKENYAALATYVTTHDPLTDGSPLKAMIAYLKSNFPTVTADTSKEIGVYNAYTLRRKCGYNAFTANYRDPFAQVKTAVASAIKIADDGTSIQKIEQEMTYNDGLWTGTIPMGGYDEHVYYVLLTIYIDGKPITSYWAGAVMSVESQAEETKAKKAKAKEKNPEE